MRGKPLPPEGHDHITLEPPTSTMMWLGALHGAAETMGDGARAARQRLSTLCAPPPSTNAHLPSSAARYCPAFSTPTRCLLAPGCGSNTVQAIDYYYPSPPPSKDGGCEAGAGLRRPGETTTEVG